MNLAETCFRKRTVTVCLAAALAVAGVRSYFGLGRLEDPAFAIRAAQIVTSYPGATASEVAARVTDPIETAVQRLGRVKHVTSTSSPGRSIVTVELRDDLAGDDLPQAWTELRHKVGDVQGELPQGCAPPVVNDDYGDVYGVFFAISGDGYTPAELKEHAKLLRKELLLCEDVAKIDILGDRQQIVSLEIPRVKIAALGLTPEKIAAALAGHTTPSDAGNLRVGDKYIRLDLVPDVTSLDGLSDVLVADGVSLGDVCTFRFDYADPPSVLVRRNGKPCLALGISAKRGGSVVAMGRAVEKRMRELLPTTPIGIEVDVISHQATRVETAVGGFVANLVASVALVIAALLFTMGLRAGLVIGGVLVLTVLGTVWVMDLCGLVFERISLGAFVIALGMLVDNAIVVTEAVRVAGRQGRSRTGAAIAVVRQTQWTLLGGTAIAVLAFAPIGVAQGAVGEYCRSLFLVIAIALLLGWALAVTVTPLLAAWGLGGEGRGEKEEGKRKKEEEGGGEKGEEGRGKGEELESEAGDPYGGALFRGYRRALEWCIDNRGFTILALSGLLAASVAGFARVKRNFFPDSTRPQFMVHVWMPEGTLITKTDRRVAKVSEFVGELEGVTGVSSFTGQGALRFLLSYTPEEPDSAYGLLLVDVADSGAIAGLMRRIESAAPALVPDADVACQRFVLGPGEAHRIQVRLLGPDPERLRAFGDAALAILRADGLLKDVQSDWRNRAELVEPVVSEARAAKLGLSRSDVARAFRLATDGVPVGTYQLADEALPIVLRAKKGERDTLTGVNAAWAWSSSRGVSVPLAQVVDREILTSEEMRLRRRDWTPCLTVKCNPPEGETAASAFARVRPALDAFAARLPAGYRAEYGGEYEDAKEANGRLAPSFLPLAAAMAFIVLMLFDSVKKTLVILLTLPLIVVGAVAGLLACGQPFGFMALLGLLSLVGMQARNAIVLMDEIGAKRARGLGEGRAVVEAGVSRLRPAANVALTTVLGLVPLLTDAFYVAMAVTIMAGLAFAAVLTMVVMPVIYALVFRVRCPE